jgi:hypothetical protein
MGSRPIAAACNAIDVMTEQVMPRLKATPHEPSSAIPSS